MVFLHSHLMQCQFFLSFMVFCSGYNEERNLLRLRAWEQRNQETSQAKELNHDNVPLFGEPYKVFTYCQCNAALKTVIPD